MSGPADDPFAGYRPPALPRGGLPIADIPYLARCLTRRGLCDPVTNILLATIYAFAQDKDHLPGLLLHPSKEEVLQQAKDRLTFVDAIHRSRLGLIKFMTCYFRYLAYDEAKQCLAMASHDHPLAVLLVEKSCGSLLGHPGPRFCHDQGRLGEGC
ncbi:hypothetical protein ACQ4PT_007721 [Festuca glaucescens]